VSLEFHVAIPARLGSTRLPRKPLRLLAGRPLIVHVAERALAAGAREVVVATDDAEIAAACRGLAVEVCMTRADHASGTDRLAEVAVLRAWPDEAIVVNLQGDEPQAPVEGVRHVAEVLARAPEAVAATLAVPIESSAQLFDPNVVKLVRDTAGFALYFSRAPIPWHRDAFRDGRKLPPADAGAWLRHIGIYAYRAGFLRRFTALPPSMLERIESLEQLRILEAGQRIAVGLSPAPFPAGVDTEEDLRRVEMALAGGPFRR
jgi:3-deoxy-manno-octulosonate cytidylyltransferase (CMP-KDO synthetase)